MKETKVKKVNNNGITLIALIITIILLLILTIVSIRLVVNDEIIVNSKNTVSKYNEEELKEKILLAYNEYKMKKILDSTYTLEDALNNAQIPFILLEGNDEKGYEITVKTINGEKIFSIAPDGKITIISKWHDNGDNTYTLGETTLKLGDKVYYNELSNGIQSSLVKAAESGSTAGNQTLTTEDLEWRVFGINNKGEVELISTKPTTQTVRLRGDIGAYNGVRLLNSTCNDLYGQGKGAVSARSLDVDDLNKLAGINTDSDKRKIHSLYGNKWRYKYSEDAECIQYSCSTDKGITWSEWKDLEVTNNKTFKIPGKEVLNSKNLVAEELIQSCYDYKISSKITTKIENNTILLSDVITNNGSTAT